jgi:hypothetical protein
MKFFKCFKNIGKKNPKPTDQKDAYTWAVPFGKQKHGQPAYYTDQEIIVDGIQPKPAVYDNSYGSIDQVELIQDKTAQPDPLLNYAQQPNEHVIKSAMSRSPYKPSKYVQYYAQPTDQEYFESPPQHGPFILPYQHQSSIRPEYYGRAPRPVHHPVEQQMFYPTPFPPRHIINDQRLNNLGPKIRKHTPRGHRKERFQFAEPQVDPHLFRQHAYNVFMDVDSNGNLVHRRSDQYALPVNHFPRHHPRRHHPTPYGPPPPPPMQPPYEHIIYTNPSQEQVLNENNQEFFYINPETLNENNDVVYGDQRFEFPIQEALDLYFKSNHGMNANPNIEYIPANLVKKKQIPPLPQQQVYMRTVPLVDPNVVLSEKQRVKSAKQNPQTHPNNAPLVGQQADVSAKTVDE